MAVIGLEIEECAPVLDGQSFGEAGTYQKLSGTIRFAVDPDHRLHRTITDIEYSPRNAEGLVEFWSDFYLLQPVDPARGNRRLIVDVLNRGRKVALGSFNSAVNVPDPSTPEDLGNGFLMRRGYTIAWVGWQHDVPRQNGLMALSAPVARSESGPLLGRRRCWFQPNLPAAYLPLADRYHVPHPAFDLDDPEAELMDREDEAAPANPVPREAWCFARLEDGQVVPDPKYIHLKRGFVPGHVYELVYRVQDPPVAGLGFLAYRDTASFLKFAGHAEDNPCAERIDYTFAYGVSQSGRFLRHLLYLGLDEDEQGRMVFDAMIQQVAGARRGEFNFRFAQPSLNIIESVSTMFPFSGVTQIDPDSGKRDGILRRLQERGSMPKIFAINTSSEYWRGDASLLHTSVDGQNDLDPLPEVRIYHIAGTQHGPGALPPVDEDATTHARGRHPANTVDFAPLLRAALDNLDRWVSEGVEPPTSQFPRLADRSAVVAESTAELFCSIPGVRFPDQICRPVKLDFGPEIDKGIASQLPPLKGKPYRTYVSALDQDGNEIAGVQPAEVRMPLGTFTGWNTRHPALGAPGSLLDMRGSTFPFPRTHVERERSGDPRLSIEERYPSRQEYLERVREIAEEMLHERWVLAEDIERIVTRAGKMYDLFQEGLRDPLNS